MANKMNNNTSNGLGFVDEIEEDTTESVLSFSYIIYFQTKIELELSAEQIETLQTELPEEAKFIKDVFSTLKFRSWTLLDNDVIFDISDMQLRSI